MCLLTISTLVSLMPLPACGFVSDTERYVEFNRDIYHLFGRLDEFGHFNELGRIELTQMPEATSRSFPANILIDGWFKPVFVYEFRYGRLIPGTMHRGEFTPDLDGKPIRFADYRCTSADRPIWNLPGYFRPVYPLSRWGELSAALAGATIIAGTPLAKTNRELFMQWADAEVNRIKARKEKSRK